MARASCLEVQLLCEYDTISGQRTEVTLMAKVKAQCLESEERRAPITICAAIDRRFGAILARTGGNRCVCVSSTQRKHEGSPGFAKGHAQVRHKTAKARR